MNRKLSEIVLVLAVCCSFIQRSDYAVVLESLAKIFEKHKIDTLDTLDDALWGAGGKE